MKGGTPHLALQLLRPQLEEGIPKYLALKANEIVYEIPKTIAKEKKNPS